MKAFKIRLLFMAIVVILFVGFVFIGCENNPEINVPEEQGTLEGKILIFSAYGGSNTNAPTHSFVELYNPTDNDVSLNGFTLQWAGYDKDNGDWQAIPLSGTIKSKHSYLILGQFVNTPGRIQLQDGEGDVNDDNMLLGNRGFRLALIKGTAVLTVDNPFNIDGNGAKAAGYIDSVGARNDLSNVLVGWEGPAYLENTIDNFPRNSSQESIRRKNLIDTDNNADDFVSVRSTVVRSATYLHGVNDSELEIYKPKNTAYGAWDPFGGIEEWQPETTYTVTQIGGTEGTVTSMGVQFTFSAAIDSLNISPNDITVGGAGAKELETTFVKSSGNTWVLSPITVNASGNATVSINKTGIEAIEKNVAVYKEGAVTFEVKAGDQDALARKLLILQAYAPSNSPAGASHPFVELYNSTNVEIELDGITLYYASGDTGTTTDHPWRKIALTGSIPSESSFLILGPKAVNTSGTRYVIDTKHGADHGDINDENFTLSNNAYKITIIRTAFENELNVQNPFTMDGAGIADGYIDMVGAHNAAANTINGYESAPARCSASEAVRRKNITDTDNNQGISSVYANGTGDFDSMRYATGSGGISDALLELRYPRNSKAGKWDPFAQPQVEITYTVAQIGGEDNTTTTTGIQFTFSSAIDSLNVTIDNITVGGTAEKELETTFAKSSGNIWLLSPITINEAGNATVSINKTDIEATVKTIEVFKQGQHAEIIHLMIFHVGAATDGNISHSFIELYNNTNSEINLTGYSIQYAAGWSSNAGNGAPGGSTTKDGDWNKIDLTGKIPAFHSFLILGNNGTSANPALNLESVTGDMTESFVINNRCFKVLLIKSTTLLSNDIQNPFDTDGTGTKAANYIDMVGAINTANTDYIQGFEGTRISNLNKQTGQRRKSLTDTDNNAADFARAVFDGASANDIELLKPKNVAHGAWNPITGEKIE